MTLAVVHVLGALFASFVFGLLVFFISAAEQAQVQKRRVQAASLALNVPAAALDSDDSLVPRLLEYWSQRCSGELLRNRLSDICGSIRTAWGWLGTFLHAAISAAVGWAIYSEGAKSAVYIWAALAVAVTFWLASVAFSFACMLFTGRYPGEANASRKALAAFIEQRNGTAPPLDDSEPGKVRAWLGIAGGTALVVVALYADFRTDKTVETSAPPAPSTVADWRQPGLAEPDRMNLANSVVTAESAASRNQPPPVPEFTDLDARLAYLRWLGAMSSRLHAQMPEWELRKEFVQTVWFESRRAGVDTALVLGLVEATSGFRKFYVSERDARGYMGVAALWSSKIGNGDVAKLFQLQTNLRFGCVLLRHFIDQRRGDVDLALQDYYAANLAPHVGYATTGKSFADEVQLNAQQHWSYRDIGPGPKPSKATLPSPGG